MTRPDIATDVFCVKYVQAYMKRFNKNPEFPGGVVEGYSVVDGGLSINIFLLGTTIAGTSVRADKNLTWEEIIPDAILLGVSKV